jgi:phage regulator Rha-like protein
MNQLINNNKQTMTSREIAALVGKPHNDVMKAIRVMEPAWEKIHGGNFSLSFEIRQLDNGGTKKDPYYELNKFECLYIATKFNDEARARLVLRWAELEAIPVNKIAIPGDIEERIRVLEAKSITTEITEFTVFGFANMQRKKLYGNEAMTIGKRAAKICREMKLPVNKVMDQRFGWVNVYPEPVLKDVFEDFFKNPRF